MPCKTCYWRKARRAWGWGVLGYCTKKWEDSGHWKKKHQTAFSGELTLEEAMNLAEYVTLMTSLRTHLAFLDLKQMPGCIPAPVLNKLQTCQPLNHFWFTYPELFNEVYFRQENFTLGLMYTDLLTNWLWMKMLHTWTLDFHFTMHKWNLVAYHCYFTCLWIFW